MNDQIHKDKGFLKDKLGGYQVHPPERVWDSISGQLSGGSRRRNMIILVFAAAASLALALTLGIQYFSPELPQESGLASEDLPRVVEPAGDTGLLKEKVLEAVTELEAEEPGMPESSRTESILATKEPAREDPVRDDPIKEGHFIEDPAPEDIQQDASELPSGKTRVLALNPEEDENLKTEEESNLPDTEPLPDFYEESQKDIRWTVGAAMSPLYSFRDAESRVMAGAGVHESGILSYSSGVHVNYRRGSRLAFETGIFFNKTGLAIGAAGIQAYNQQRDYLLFGAGSERADIKAVTNSVGNIISNSGEIFVNAYKMNAQNSPEALMDGNFQLQGNAAEGIEQHLDYLELPFNLRYTVIDRAFELQLVGGLSTNFLVNNYVTMETASGPREIGYLTNIRTVNYSGNAGLGMIYHLGTRLNLMVEPRFRYFLNSINDATLPSTRPYSIGLYTSLNYTF